MLRTLPRVPRILVILLLVCGSLLSALSLSAADRPARAIVVAQISDTHIGSERAPHAAEVLSQIVDMINERHPDVVIVTGDIGEDPGARAHARQILSRLTAKTYFVPGNHDARADTIAEWRREFGPDYYQFEAGGFTFLVLDSLLLGSYEPSSTAVPKPLSPQAEKASKQMLDWLQAKADKKPPVNAAPIFVVQHVPLMQGDKGPVLEPFLTAQAPYADRELDLLHRIGVHHLFAGHWHWGLVFTTRGLTTHVAPSTAGPSSHPLGFALHTITPAGEVTTSFIALRGSSLDSGTRDSGKPAQ